LYTLKLCYNIEWCGDDVDDTTEENSSIFSLIQIIIKCMQAIKLAGCFIAQVDPYNDHKMIVYILKKIDLLS